MNDLFNKAYSIFNGLPKPGQEITFIQPAKFGFHKSILEDEKNLLIPCAKYTVKRVEVASSSTYVCLEEFWVDGLDEYRNNQKKFNLGSFGWIPPEIVPEELIGLDARFSLQFKNRYDIGLKVDGKVCIEGAPILVLETKYDEKYRINEIISAKFENDNR